MDYTQILIGIPAGILTSVATLLFFHFIFAPRVNFSQDVRISKNPATGRLRYTVRVTKTGFVDLIDTTIQCRIAVRDKRYYGNMNWFYYNVPTSFSNSLFMTKSARRLNLYIEDAKLLDEYENPVLGTHTKVANPVNGLRFEDLFMQYESVYVSVLVLGHDGFTGVKKLFRSPKYRFYNFVEGSFVGNAVVAKPVTSED